VITVSSVAFLKSSQIVIITDEKKKRRKKIGFVSDDGVSKHKE
jgi:hypothetical protein